MSPGEEEDEEEEEPGGLEEEQEEQEVGPSMFFVTDEIMEASVTNDHVF